MYNSTIKFIVMLSVLFALCACQSTPTLEPSQVANTTQVIIQGVSEGKEEIQTIEIDNCDGKGDATRTEQRSQSVDVTISAEIAAKIGASAEIISAEVQAAVGVANTQGKERSTSIQLTAPPGTRMLFQLMWTGKEQIGIVENIRGSSIPIAFRDFTPTDVRIKSQSDIGCPGSNSPKPIVTSDASPTSTPIVPVQPPTAKTTVQPTECPPPAGLIALWKNIEPPWSKGIWGSPNMPNFMVALGEVDTNDPDFGEFQIWIDPCSIEWHGYKEGGRFWPHQPGINPTASPIPLGGEKATSVTLPANTGIWGLGPSY
jgi:hypothetical protein